MSVKYICLFNHKGGVCKTTTAYHLAWKLTDFGKRVLLVDTDSQCNLTGLILGSALQTFYRNPQTQTDNLYDALSGMFSGNAIAPGTVQCPVAHGNQNLLLLPSHPNVAEFEGQLSLALSGAAPFMAQQNLPGGFFELIERCATTNRIDYALIDMNPALSSLNKIFFSMCDGFIVPTVPDPFCVMALDSLTKVLPAWRADIDQYIKTHSAAKLKLPLKSTRFIGEIIQRYSLREQKPSKAYAPVIEEIKTKVRNVFRPALVQAGMTFTVTATGASIPAQTGDCIAQMPEFLSLLQKSVRLHKPVFAITDAEIGNPAMFQNLINKRDSVERTFNDVAKLIFALLP